MGIHHVSIQLETVSKYLISSGDIVHRLLHRGDGRGKRPEVEPVRVRSRRHVKWPVAAGSHLAGRLVDESQLPNWEPQGGGSREHRNAAGIAWAVVIQAAPAEASWIVARVTGRGDFAIS